ncbi:MAG: glycoside hydrolase family 36 protein [Oscillospiraceae bacterium]|nr:glycoside hydrolase family 36 protein [Oscillospiraceae bacterium]
MDKKYIISFKSGSNTVVTNETENDFFSLDIVDNENRFSVILKPKKPFELVDFYVEFPYEFKKGDSFFAGGYQSWTTTREYKADEIQKGITKLAGITKLTKDLARLASDERIVKYTQKPGEFHSHCYTYVKNGGKVKFWGSLSEKTGFTYFKVRMNENYFSIRKDALGKLVEEPWQVFDIVYFEGGYDEVFDKYFSLSPMPEARNRCMSGYTSWYNYFQKIDEGIILRDLNGLDRAKDEVSIFQIDDGYESFVGDWLVPDPKKFPHGMKYIADKIHDKGYNAGIWLAPFSCQRVSQTAKLHPDWLIKENGKPMLGCLGWGGAYTLDIYNPEARAYIKKFFDVVLNEWGFDMVKLDFLYSECMIPRAGKCRGEIMHDAMLLLRECVGDKLILGCGVPLGSALGIVDACRISCDVDLDYIGKIYNRLNVSNEVPSAQNAITNSVFRRHLNGRAFMNDPDVFFLRNDNLKFTDEQKVLLAEINNLCGNVLFVSDNAGAYDEMQTERLKKYLRKTDKKILDAEYLDKDVIRIKTEQGGETCNFVFNIKKGIIMSNNK